MTLHLAISYLRNTFSLARYCHSRLLIALRQPLETTRRFSKAFGPLHWHYEIDALLDLFGVCFRWHTNSAAEYHGQSNGGRTA